VQHNHVHPSDQTLVRALDRELSVRRRLAVDRHLADCERCGARFAAMASASKLTSGLTLHGETIPSTDAVRRRLRAEMAELSAQWDRSLSFRMRRAFSTAPFAVRVVAVVALMAVVLPLLRSAWGIVAPVPVEAAALPIHALTPGAIAGVDRESLCAGRLPVRSPIAPSVRQVVLRQYRMEGVPEWEYELDYLITPELGGTADPANLWPERYASGPWNARVKDDLERLLPQLVCQGSLDLATAQQAIADNWIAAYKKYLKTDRPLARQAGLIDDDDRERERSNAEAVGPIEEEKYALDTLGNGTARVDLFRVVARQRLWPR
jgi:hypothetical protein